MLLLLALFLLYMYLLLSENTRILKDESDPEKTSIGNCLSRLFFNIGNSWRKGETYHWKTQHLAKNDFYLNLPSDYEPLKGLQVPKYKTEDYDGGSAWQVDTEEGKIFWDTMKPYIHKTLDETLEKSGLFMNQKNPIIHFRCSDVPFNRHSWYHLAKWDFYRKALNGHSEVDVLMCPIVGATEDNKKACHQYIEFLKKELSPVKVNVSCGHFLEDFARMFYGPLVISPGSSMSFMSGYFGHGKLVTTGHFEEGSSDTCKICEGDKSSVLLHSDVPDYHDVENVNKMLKGNIE